MYVKFYIDKARSYHLDYNTDASYCHHSLPKDCGVSDFSFFFFKVYTIVVIPYSATVRVSCNLQVPNGLIVLRK